MLIFAVLFAILAVVMFKVYTRKQQEIRDMETKAATAKLLEVQKQQAEEMKAKLQAVAIVSARVDIQENTRITEDMLVMWEILKSSASQDMLTWDRRGEIIGMVTRFPVFKGEPISKNKLASKQKSPKLSYQINPGMRAVSIKIDQVSSVSGFIKQNDTVDIIATFANRGKESVAFSRTILQNVRVIAIGNKFILGGGETISSGGGSGDVAPPGEGPPAEGGGPAQGEGPVQMGVTANTITLEVSLKDSERLTLALQESKLQLVLRNPSYRDYDSTKGIDQGTLMLGPSESDIMEQQERVRRSEKKEVIIRNGNVEQKVYVDKVN
jgi:pilus assembly protein CpaB